MATSAAYIDLDEGAAPSTPPAATARLYTKSDGLLYWKDDAGNEYPVGSSSTTVATDPIWDAAGDLPVGTGANTAARLPIGAAGKLLKSDGSTAGWAAATLLPLDYTLGSDINGTAITLNTWTDVIANQNFAVTSATSVIEISVRGSGFFNSATAGDAISTRVVIDSGGTPINEPIGSGQAVQANSGRPNIFSGASPVFKSGLSVATHTVKVQVRVGRNLNLFIRASSNPDEEWLRVQVAEHL